MKIKLTENSSNRKQSITTTTWHDHNTEAAGTNSTHFVPNDYPNIVEGNSSRICFPLVKRLGFSD